MTEHVIEEQLILHYYGEAEDSASIDRHLRVCEECREGYQSLLRLLNGIDVPPVPARSANYGAQVWDRIGSRVGGRIGWREWFAWRKLAAITAMATLVLAAFLAGRYSRVSQQPAQTAQVRNRVLLVAVGDHLERSRMVLAEVANTQAEGDLDLSAEKMMAENLVESNRLFRQTAVATGEAGVAGVLDELERVLMEIAHSPDTVSAGQLEEIQKRIESQGLLFKVRVVESQVRARESRPKSKEL
jgi:hypothetical protein